MLNVLIHLLCIQVFAIQILTQYETDAVSSDDIHKFLYDALYENNTDKVIQAAEQAKKELNIADISHILRYSYSFRLSERAVAVCIAGQKNNIEAMKQLVSLGANINENCYCVEKTDPPPEVDSKLYSLYCSVLGMAAKKNSTEMVRYLLEKGATENKALLMHDFKSAAHLAVDNNNADTIKLIGKHKAGIDISTYPYFTPLYYAVKKGNIRMVKALLKSGANVTAEDDWSNYFCALHAVVEAPENQEEITKLLLKKGANLEQKSAGGRTPLDWAFFAYNHEPSVLYLKSKTFSRLWKLDANLRGLLRCSFNQARKELLEQKDLDLEQISPKQFSPQENEIVFSSPWIALNLFIKVGANVNESRLIEAIKDRDWETARVLYRGKFKGSIKNVMSTLNLTFCHVAIIFRDLSLIESQNNTSEMINLKDSNGDAPIFIALMDKYYEGLKLLVKKGANFEVQNSKGQTASSLAKYLYHKSIELIIKKGFS